MFTVDHFIKKFSEIPENKWGVAHFYNEYSGTSCAYGHCGVRITNLHVKSEETRALSDLFGVVDEEVMSVNDNEELGGTPKSRILDVLYKVKEKLELELTEKSVIFVQELVNTPAKELV